MSAFSIFYISAIFYKGGIMNNTSRREIIKEYVMQAEEVNSKSSSTYDAYIKKLKEINNLDNFSSQNVSNIIKPFLIDWGKMGRVVGQVDNWQQKLAKKIQEKCKKISKFRKLNLSDEDLSIYEFDIKNLYETFREIKGENSKNKLRRLGQVAASKILHILCPDFFPMWDDRIASAFRDEHNSLGMNDNKIEYFSKEEYYKFMLQIQWLMREYSDILGELSINYQRTKLRILDEFLWLISKNPLFLFFKNTAKRVINPTR